MSAKRRDGRAGRATLIAALLVVAAAFAGCSALKGPGDGAGSLPDAEEAQARAEQLDGVRVTMNTTMRHNGTATWSIQRMSIRPETGEFRNVVRAAGPPSANESRAFPPGSRVVSNGSVRYIYAADADRIFRSDVSNQSRGRGDEMRRLFAALNEDGAEPIRHPTPGVSPLPVVPAGSQSGGADNESVRWRRANVTAEYNGTATVAGRSTYVVDLRPAEEESSLVASTLWLDTEYLYPVRSHRIVDRRGERYEYTSVARNLTFNPEFPPGTFEFDPDAVGGDPTVVDSQSYDSRREMAADLDWPVPDPDLPEGFEFESGFYADGERRHLSVTYASGDGNRSLRVSVFGEPANLTDGRGVTLSGRTAEFGTFRGRRVLRWNMHGRGYSVSSGHVGNATLRRVAESLLPE